MASATLSKLGIALALFLLAQASSAFVSPSGASSVSKGRREIGRCAKRENCPGKTAFDKQSKVSGIGALNFGNFGGGGKKKAASTQNKRAPKKNANAKKVAKTTVTGNSAKADLDWGKIIVAFLTPWRNPNSIFLYMFLILYILGETNK